MAKKERERLKLQAITKKRQLEKLREEQNTDTAAGDVSFAPIVKVPQHA